jgi:hypothetical protein
MVAKNASGPVSTPALAGTESVRRIRQRIAKTLQKSLEECKNRTENHPEERKPVE